MFYRDYKRFDKNKFETELKLELNSQSNISYSTFQAVLLEILNFIGPVLKKSYVLTTMTLQLNFSEKR